MSPGQRQSDGVLPHLSAFDSVFVRTVIEHRGANPQPTFAEFAAAFEMLRRYYQQCLDNPREENPREENLEEPHVAGESLAALRAKVFVMFGATKPSPAQWQQAYRELFGSPDR